MKLPITNNMTFLVGDGIYGYLSKNDKVDTSGNNSITGYVGKTNKKGFITSIHMFDGEELEKALELDNKDIKIGVYKLDCKYEGMTTVFTENGVGMYPTYSLIFPDLSNIKVHIKVVTRDISK